VSETPSVSEGARNNGHTVDLDKRDELILGALAKDPNIPVRTLARQLVLDYPDLFGTLESARKAVSYRVGQVGVEGRDWASPRYEQFFRPGWASEWLPAPKPFWDTTPFILNYNKVLGIGDFQFPFHDREAIAVALEWTARRHPDIDAILLGGDVPDCYQMSDFWRIPDAGKIMEEIDCIKQFLKTLKAIFPNAAIIWKEGNHEERFPRTICRAIPAVAALLKSMPYAACCKIKGAGPEEMGIQDGVEVEIVRDRRPIYFGYLTIIHGHELGQGVFNPVNAARTAQLKAKDCCLVFHWHNPCQHRVKSIRQKHIGTWGVGCMCQLTAHFMPVNDWGHGFCILTKEDDAGNFLVQNLAVIQGKVY
jgi:hypothetical protein